MMIRKEIQDVVDVINQGQSLHRILREAFQVIGIVINLDDSEKNIDDAKAELALAATAVVNATLVNRPFLRLAVLASISSLANPLIDLAAQYTGTGEEFVDEYVLPQLKEFEDTIRSLRISLAG